MKEKELLNRQVNEFTVQESIGEGASEATLREGEERSNETRIVKAREYRQRGQSGSFSSSGS